MSIVAERMMRYRSLSLSCWCVASLGHEAQPRCLHPRKIFFGVSWARRSNGQIMQFAVTRRMLATVIRGSDVPADAGVCTDEIVGSYRALGVDLQKEVHEDMVQNFSIDPQRWKWISGKPDRNIDHRSSPRPEFDGIFRTQG
jgi:uncharacterized protein YijF (DUF1287 family)